MAKVNTKAIKDKIIQIAKKYGVDPKLALAVAKHESGYNPRAKSRAGAMGVFQLMPATAKGLGVKNAFDIEQNIDISGYCNRLVVLGAKLKTTDDDGNESELDERLTIEDVNDGVRYIDDEESIKKFGRLSEIRIITILMCL